MFGDYLRSFWRGVLHNKVATLINVGGLALGLTVFFALTFYVYREFSWDEQWEDADRLYNVAGSIENSLGTSPLISSSAPYVAGTTLLSRHPDAFEAYARTVLISAVGVAGENEYPNLFRYHAEPGLLDLIQFETLAGSLEEVFADPRAIAIRQREAERLFGDASPLGQVVTFKPPPGSLPTALPPADFIIKAVFTLPEPTTFSMNFLALLDPSAPLPQLNSGLDVWMARSLPPAQPGQPGTFEVPFNVQHYFKLREGVDAAALEADLRAFMDEGRILDNGYIKTRFIFRKLYDLHLSPSPLLAGDNIQRLWVYAAIGVLVLLVSGSNFVMLATLRLVDRMREVGIRKSVGGGGGQLLWQYLVEAFFLILLAAGMAVLFLGFTFPKFAVMLQLPLQIDLLTARNLGLCLLMVLGFTLISSLYPAWMSSQTKPGPLLRNGAGAVVGTGTGLRKLLVGLQFAIVVVLLLASAVVRQQIEYTRNRDPGYSLENVLQVNTSTGVGLSSVIGNMPAIVTEFRKVPGVEGVGVGSTPPNLPLTSVPTPLRAFGADGSIREAGLGQRMVGADFFRVLSIRVLAGREFSEQDAPPPPAPGVPAAPNASPRNIMLNASAVRALGFASPEAAVDQLLELESRTPDGQVRRQNLRVIGVVVDTQLSSVMMPPVAEYYNFGLTGIYLAVKVGAGENVAAVTDDLKAAWDTVLNGVTPFVIEDSGSSGNFLLRREEFEANVITVSTVFAIVIALLGLYGLVAATVIKRVKEIGVRKVMGAERSTIVTLFLVQFSKPIVVANVVAWPFGFWAIRQWLQRFPYQLDVSVIVLSGPARRFCNRALRTGRQYRCAGNSMADSRGNGGAGLERETGCRTPLRIVAA